ncbi:hypothetical protein [Streptomyces sp. NPDC055287]
MPALCHVPRAVRSGTLMALLVLVAAFAVLLGEGGPSGQARPPVWGAVGEAAPSGMGGGGASGGEADSVDSEVRGGGEGARSARRGRLLRGGRGRAPEAVAAYRRAGRGQRRVWPGLAPGAPGEVRRSVILRC